MTDAVIVSTARTPLAKSWKGGFNMTHPVTLGGHALEHAIIRAGIEPAEVDDLILGCAFPEGAAGMNIARQVALRAGCPVTTSGQTVNRFCSSGLQSIAMAAQRIIAGEGDVFAAGGVESISLVQNRINQNLGRERHVANQSPAVYWNMLKTAETVASRYGISREAQDAYGAQSQQRAATAQVEGRFDEEIAPLKTVMGPLIQRPAVFAGMSWKWPRMKAFAPAPPWMRWRNCHRPCPVAWYRRATPASFRMVLQPAWL